MAITAVITVDLRTETLEKIKSDKNRDNALNRVHEVIIHRMESTVVCEFVRKYTLALDMPADQGALGALIYWCESVKIPYEIKWLFSGLD